jgi:hypothetical protein
MSILSQSIDILSFDNSFSSFSETQPQAPSTMSLSQINSILSSLEEIEQFVNIHTHKEREIQSILRTLTTIISKCTNIQNTLQSRSKHSTIKVTNEANNDDDETFQYFEQALTPKFNFNKKFDCSEYEPNLISFCDGPSPSSSECSSLNSSIMVESIHLKTLLKTVKDIQDKGIITKKQKKFLKEKIISKDIELYSFISKYDNNNIDLTRAIRTYLKQFKIIE